MDERLFLIFGTLVLVNVIFATDILVNIKNGTLEGSIMKTRKGLDIFAFRGIPYALPPLGELRFEVSKKLIY